MWSCLPKCAECCGITLFPIQFWESFKHRRACDIKEEIITSEEVAIVTEDMFCIFLDRKSNACAVYEDRPQLCRDYGVIEALPCPYIRPNGNPRSPAQVRHWQRVINHDVDNQMKRIERAHNANKL